MYDVLNLKKYIEEKNIEGIKYLLDKNQIILKDGKFFTNNKKECKEQETFWNQRQQARKILLNSLYGALLNEASTFFDQRVGQSVTLSGRSIVRHMNAKINEVITGKYDIEGDGIVYIDTDSAYFSIEKLVDKFPSRDDIVVLYDNIADIANNSFPDFMNKTFNTGLKEGAIIKAGREIVGSRGLFIKKKKYAILVYDKEGVRYDKDGKPGKLKAMGLDLKRADTPKVMQDFLEEILMDLLVDKTQEDIFSKIRIFREKFHLIESWEKGTPKKVNSLTEYAEKVHVDNDILENFDMSSLSKLRKNKDAKKPTVPGHVRASLNWNKLRELNKDRYSTEITDGTKIVVCKLKKNDYKINSVAYPVDQFNLPSWFKELPFDDDLMEETIIDKKLLNLLGVLNWNLVETKVDTTFNDLFD